MGLYLPSFGCDIGLVSTASKIDASMTRNSLSSDMRILIILVTLSPPSYFVTVFWEELQETRKSLEGGGQVEGGNGNNWQMGCSG